MDEHYHPNTMKSETNTPETDDHESCRDAMSTRASSDYFSTLELCRKIERERDDARREILAIKAMLLDPTEVELDMIRGNIAIPQRREFDHISSENVSDQTPAARVILANVEAMRGGDSAKNAQQNNFPAPNHRTATLRVALDEVSPSDVGGFGAGSFLHNVEATNPSPQ